MNFIGCRHRVQMKLADSKSGKRMHIVAGQPPENTSKISKSLLLKKGLRGNFSHHPVNINSNI